MTCVQVLNQRCVDAGVATALALNAQVKDVSYFDRKHYSYHDLPVWYTLGDFGSGLLERIPNYTAECSTSHQWPYPHRLRD